MSGFRHFTRPEILLLPAWTLELTRLVWSHPAFGPIGAGIMAVYVLLALPRLRRQTLALCTVLASITIGLATLFGSWAEIGRGMERTPIFAAFFGTILILRATADRRPETRRTQGMFQDLSAGQRIGAFLIGAYLIGVLLVVGAMAVLAPIQGNDATEAERRTAAEACLRGMCLAPLWSPFWIAMAVAYQQLPDVPLWQVIALGLPLSAVGLFVSHLIFARNVGIRELWWAVWGLRPIIPPVAISAAAIVLLTSFTDFSTLQTVILCVPLLCGAALSSMGRRALTSALSSVSRGMGGVTDEIALVTVALVLGRVLAQAMTDEGMAAQIGAFGPPPLVLIGATMILMTIAALVGIHQLVSMTVILASLAPVQAGLAKPVLMEAALVGWAFASMVGISAVSATVAASMFRIPVERLVYGVNLKFVLAFGIGAALILAAVNRYAF